MRIIKDVSAKAVPFAITFMMVCAAVFGVMSVIVPDYKFVDIVVAADQDDWNITSWNSSITFTEKQKVSVGDTSFNDYVLVGNNSQVHQFWRSNGTERGSFSVPGDFSNVMDLNYDDTYIYVMGRNSGSYPLGIRFQRFGIDSPYTAGTVYTAAGWYYPARMTINDTYAWITGANTSNKEASVLKVQLSDMSYVNHSVMPSAPAADSYLFDIELDSTGTYLYAAHHDGSTGANCGIWKIWADNISEAAYDTSGIITFNRDLALCSDTMIVTSGQNAQSGDGGWVIWDNNLDDIANETMGSGDTDHDDSDICAVNSTHFAHSCDNGSIRVYDSSGNVVTDYTGFTSNVGSSSPWSDSIGDQSIYVCSYYGTSWILRNITFGSPAPAPGSSTFTINSGDLVGSYNNITWALDTGGAAWSNGSAGWQDGDQLNITLHVNSSSNYSDIWLNMGSLTYSGNTIAAGDLNAFVSVDDLLGFDSVGYDLSSGSNFSFADNWASLSDDSNPFPIDGAGWTNHTLYVRFYLDTTQANAGTYVNTTQWHVDLEKTV